MLNQDIYNAALRILAESTEIDANDDYEERAPYLIAAFCAETEESDRVYREANSLEAASEVNAVYLELSAEFPRSARFASAAAMYLAAMLVIDTNFELSDRLYDKFSDMLSTIYVSIPASVEEIANKYGF